MGGGKSPPPPPPPPTPPTAPTPADTSVIDAGAAVKTKAKGGIGSTIATGGGGLLGEAQTNKKSLLGD